MISSLETRQHETVIEIDATPEDLWQAITTADGIARWLAPRAEIEASVGGRCFIEWSPGVHFDTRIAIIEPNRRLRLEERRTVPHSCGLEEEATPLAEPILIAMEYFLETNQGKTVLRLVHSGFANNADWDAEYEGSKRGWAVHFKLLKFAIESHRGDAVKQIFLMVTPALSQREAWELLQQHRAIGSIGRLASGDRFAINLNDETTLEGEVFDTGLGLFSGSISNLNDSLIAIFCEPTPGGSMAMVTLALFGKAIERADDLRQRWTAVLDELFPAIAEAATATD